MPCKVILKEARRAFYGIRLPEKSLCRPGEKAFGCIGTAAVFAFGLCFK
jgi:hypothetical protein